MFFILEDKVFFIGEENIFVEFFIDESDGFIGYVKFIYFIVDIEGELISLKCVEVVIRSVVENICVLNFFGYICYFGMCEDIFRVCFKYKGLLMKFCIGVFFEIDIIFCI